jgi:hypothetical protein
MFGKMLLAALVALGVGASTASAETLKVTNPNDSGPGTLRRAINVANTQTDRDVIEFDLPAASTVITPLADLPAFTAPVVVDGLSQPGAVPGAPVVVIDAVNTTRALELATDGGIVRGLVINDSSGVALTDGVQILGDGNRIELNLVGTDAAGASLGGWNLTAGVAITGNTNVVVDNLIADVDGDGVAIAGDDNQLTGNRIGPPIGGGLGNHGNGVSIAGNGNRVAGDNVIADSSADGVSIAGNQNLVEANSIGTDETGASGIGNVGDGVSITGNANQVADNTISDNNDAGVLVDGTSNTIMGNAIGTDPSGTAALGNRHGVVLHGNANRVGGLAEGERNVISGSGFDGVLVGGSFNVIANNLVSGNGAAGVKLDVAGFGPPIGNVVERNVISDNQHDGVAVVAGQRNAVVDNSIADNGDLGIDLADDGPTVNDGLLDPDTGANGLLNHPTIRNRSLVSYPFPALEPETELSWTLRSAASTDYRLEFYAAEACDDSGHGEAPELVETQIVTTDATGLAEGSFTHKRLVGKSVAATATAIGPSGALGATSELSPCA